MMIYLLLMHTSDQSFTAGIISSSQCQVFPFEMKLGYQKLIEFMTFIYEFYSYNSLLFTSTINVFVIALTSLKMKRLLVSHLLANHFKVPMVLHFHSINLRKGGGSATKTNLRKQTFLLVHRRWGT